MLAEIYDEVRSGNEIRSVIMHGDRFERFPIGKIDGTLTWQVGEKVSSVAGLGEGCVFLPWLIRGDGCPGGTGARQAGGVSDPAQPGHGGHLHRDHDGAGEARMRERADVSGLGEVRMVTCAHTCACKRRGLGNTCEKSYFFPIAMGVKGCLKAARVTGRGLYPRYQNLSYGWSTVS